MASTVSWSTSTTSTIVEFVLTTMLFTILQRLWTSLPALRVVMSSLRLFLMPTLASLSTFLKISSTSLLMTMLQCGMRVRTMLVRKMMSRLLGLLALRVAMTRAQLDLLSRYSYVYLSW
ncbi:hypothetical protein EV421DRAFT_1982184 [Armillaria borealis]|uniref:Uncharacterized protein n=1 Tax=Armillaria borealis TaxID=47425 RepID=A0AA39J4L4_9AGAR|nr:hypothetical protein EV421DRAFT_1982184 [Armillaria borealis]